MSALPLQQRIADLRFYDIVGLAKEVKGGTLGFDVNRQFKDAANGIKNAFADWCVNNLDVRKLEQLLPKWEELAEAGRAKGTGRGSWQGKKQAQSPIAVADDVPMPDAQDMADPQLIGVDYAAAQQAVGNAQASLQQSKPSDLDETRVRKIAGEVAGRLDTALKEAINEDVNAIDARIEKVEQAMERLNSARPIRLTVKREDKEVTQELGLQHHMFLTLLKLCSTRGASGDGLNVWITGPAGSGKTRAARTVAQALSVPFHFTGAIDNEFKLLGFTDAHGRCVRTPFREAYEHGGVFLFDEIDGSNPSAVLPMNAALANGQCDFPDAIVTRHKDCVILAAANTWGAGATSEYVGRVKLDAASLNRFVMLPWEYDEALEMNTSGNTEWCGKVQAMRRRVRELGIKHLVTPRATYDGAALLAAGFKVEDVASMTVRAGMSDQQWQQVTRGVL